MSWYRNVSKGLVAGVAAGAALVVCLGGVVPASADEVSGQDSAAVSGVTAPYVDGQQSANPQSDGGAATGAASEGSSDGAAVAPEDSIGSKAVTPDADSSMGAGSSESDSVAPRSSCVPDKSTIRQCFPDINFAKRVAWRTGGQLDSVLTRKMINSVTWFATNGVGGGDMSLLDGLKPIKSIEGVQVFTNMTEFGLTGQFAGTDISPLSGLAKLKKVYLEGSEHLTDFKPLYGLKNLTSLALAQSRIQDVSSLRGLTNLTWLDLSNNQVSDVSPLAGLTKLTTLYLSNNQIRDVSSLRGLTRLTWLDLSNNQVSDVSPLAGLTNLMENLSLSSNQIRDVSPLKGLTKLTNLQLAHNQIRDVSPLKTLLEAMKPNSGSWLDLSYNYITDFSPIQGAGCQGKFRAVWTDHQNAGLAPKRLAGNLRYDTAGKVVSEAFPKSSSTVVLASGGNYPDALAASGLAGALNAPVMLTDATALSSQAKDQITRLKPSRVIIVGGTAAVSKSVEQSVSKLVPAKGVTRIAGLTRYDTASQIMSVGSSKLGAKWSDTAIVSTGGGFADALSVSPYSYAKKAPIFLADSKTGLTAKTVSAVKSRGFKKVIIVGGTTAVPSKVETQVKSAGVKTVDRVQGWSRYATSEAIAKYAVKDGTLGVSNPVFATGANFPDALAGSSLAGSKKSVLVLTNPSDIKDKDVSATLSWIGQSKSSVKQAYILGGTTAVNLGMSATISDALNLCREE